MSQPLAVVSGLKAGYAGKTLIRGVDLAIYRGERIAVLGANGSGKSTLLRSLMGLADTYEGAVEVNGSSLNGLRAVERFRAGIRLMPQGGSVFSALSVRENLMLAAHAASDEGLLKRLPSADGLVQTFRAMWTKPAGLLSAGQRQALAVCMFLQTMQDAALLMADEPTANLSSDLAMEALRVITAAAPPDAALLIVEQNSELVAGWASRTLWMDQGLFVADRGAACVRAE